MGEDFARRCHVIHRPFMLPQEEVLQQLALHDKHLLLRPLQLWLLALCKIFSGFIAVSSLSEIATFLSWKFLKVLF